jgi:ABC-type multidrug transport system ATPase subunit
VTTPVIETFGLTKRFSSGQVAVDSLALTVRQGEVYGFLGPNGAGKTTTLRMLVGLVRPTAGSCRVLGLPPGSPKGLGRLGALIEEPGFYPYLSARRNLQVLARYSGSTDSVGRVLDLVGLADRSDDRYSRYSQGMRQRLGVAATLLGDPELLILDEPTNGLDPHGMAEMRALIRRLAGRGQTVVLSSHLLGEVQHVCDRVGIIHQGRLVAERHVDELGGKPRLLIKAHPARRAVELLDRLPFTNRVEMTNSEIVAEVDPGAAGRINHLLVTEGIEVSEIRTLVSTLEDLYMSVTDLPTEDAT